MEKRFITFLKKIIKKLQENLGDEYQIEVKEMEGINNTVKHSLWLIHPDRDIHPCIHLDAYFEQYKLGIELDKTLPLNCLPFQILHHGRM